MQDGWYSVEQVAEQLGLHVRTVRGYIRAGRLKAVRIGKQYRIAQADLAVFTGRPVAPTRPRVEVSTVIELTGIEVAGADRLSTLLVAGAQLPQGGAEPLRVQTIHDHARSRFKVIILGGISATAAVLAMLDGILGTENGMFQPGSDRTDLHHD